MSKKIKRIKIFENLAVERLDVVIPRVTVLLATYNGLRWLPALIESILVQSGVSLNLVIADDGSDDGTADWLVSLASRDERVLLLPSGTHRGSAGKSFFYLLTSCNLEQADFFAFADQDDVWHPDKLLRTIEFIKKSSADGGASDVMAFWPDGRQHPVIRSTPQRRLDYLFEAGGPGCSCVLTRKLAARVVHLLSHSDGVAASVQMHDWLCYAVCRLGGDRWVVLPEFTLRYRQHGNNELGANYGLRAAWRRTQMVGTGWYRQEVEKLLILASQLGESTSEMERIRCAVQSGGRLLDRALLLVYLREFRRTLLGRLVLGAYIISGWFWRDIRKQKG